MQMKMHAVEDENEGNPRRPRTETRPFQDENRQTSPIRNVSNPFAINGLRLFLPPWQPESEPNLEPFPSPFRIT